VVAENIAFGIIAAGMALGAVGVVRTQNVVHAALFLVVVLGGAAAQYILLGAEFVAWVQVLVYIGAVIVLFLFGIMLTRAPMHPEERLGNDKIHLTEPTPNVAISNSIFRVYLIPFEVAGVLLLAALIGAVVLARKD